MNKEIIDSWDFHTNARYRRWKYTLTKRGFKTIVKEASHPFKGWKGGIETVMKKACWFTVKRGKTTVKRIKIVMHDGCIVYSVADWRAWNKNPHAKLIERLHQATQENNNDRQ